MWLKDRKGRGGGGGDPDGRNIRGKKLTHRRRSVNKPEKGCCAAFMKEILFCLRSEETQLSLRATAVRGVSPLPSSNPPFLGDYSGPASASMTKTPRFLLHSAPFYSRKAAHQKAGNQNKAGTTLRKTTSRQPGATGDEGAEPRALLRLITNVLSTSSAYAPSRRVREDSTP